MQFLFAGYKLDTDRRELSRGPDLIPVEPQVFDLLTYLVENRERVVTSRRVKPRRFPIDPPSRYFRSPI